MLLEGHCSTEHFDECLSISLFGRKTCNYFSKYWGIPGVELVMETQSQLELQSILSSSLAFCKVIMGPALVKKLNLY